MAASVDSTERALASIPEGRLRALSERHDGPGLVRLASHLSLIAALAALVLSTEGWARLATQGAMGVPLVFLFTALHEATHRTAFRTEWLNGALTRVAGFLLLVPPLAFRYFHFAHHRHTQDPDRDPELARPRPASRGAYLVELTGLPYWTSQISAMLKAAGTAPLPAHVPCRARARVRRETQSHLAGYGGVAVFSIASGSTLVLDLWIVPMLLGMPWLRAYLMAEHTGCPLVPDMMANTRTTFCHRAVRWLAWEMPWHTAHHAVPTVPFHRLAELTGEIEARLTTTARGYGDAHRQIRSAFPVRRPRRILTVARLR